MGPYIGMILPIFQRGLFLKYWEECVAVLIELYKKNVTVSCVGSDLLSEWSLYWNTMLDQIRLWADIDRNCNTFSAIFSEFKNVLK